jgi:hypothetical protein
MSDVSTMSVTALHCGNAWPCTHKPDGIGDHLLLPMDEQDGQVKTKLHHIVIDGAASGRVCTGAAAYRQ